MKRTFFLLIFYISFIGNSQQLNDNVINIDSEFGNITFTKTCKQIDGSSKVNLSYKADFYLDDIFSSLERKKENVVVKITINETGEINAYEFLKEPTSFELTRFFNNFFKDIILNKRKNGNKNLNCSNKTICYTLHFYV